MLKIPKSSWSGVCCSTEREKAACLSWFHPVCDEMAPLKCEVLSDSATDATKKLRAIMKDKRGRKFLVTRTFGRRFSIKLKPLREEGNG